MFDCLSMNMLNQTNKTLSKSTKCNPNIFKRYHTNSIFFMKIKCCQRKKKKKTPSVSDGHNSEHFRSKNSINRLNTIFKKKKKKVFGHLSLLFTLFHINLSLPTIQFLNPVHFRSLSNYILIKSLYFCK